MNRPIHKPKVVFLTYMLSGGGAERSLLEIFSSFDRRRFEPILWRLDPLNMYPGYLSKTTSSKEQYVIFITVFIHSRIA